LKSFKIPLKLLRIQKVHPHHLKVNSKIQIKILETKKISLKLYWT